MDYLKWLVLMAVAIWVAVFSIPDEKLHLIFCDVGQGDAILVQWKTNQILIDGGPSKKVLSCLERHMPFFDRRIEMVILTHQNADHSNGLRYIAERYTTLQFEPVLTKGQTVRLDRVDFEVLWPDGKVLGANTISSENDLGIVGKLKFGNFDALLTADAKSSNYENPGSGLEVVKVPHHGSKFGWDEDWWRKLKPELAVISVGKNSFGHPTVLVLESLERLGIKVKRTDLEGDIEIVSDGSTWELK